MSNINVNAISKIAYKGNNQDTLEAARIKKNFYSREWLTFLQAKAIGRTICKGEQGVKLVKYMQIKDKKGKKMEKIYVRPFTVFNFLQTKEASND